MTTLDLTTLHLEKGAHKTAEDGVCLMEAVALFRGLPHSDRPACVSPVLLTFGIALNDRWDDDLRQELVPFIPRLPGTAGDGADERRGYMALDWLIRTFTPAWLRPAGLADEAAQLEGAAEIVDLSTAKAVGPVTRAVRERAAAAWAAARAAARDAAWAAARDVLKPTVEQLQASALELYSRMIDAAEPVAG